MKYFAYGSNMLSRRLRDSSRAPTAAALGSGILSGYELRFHKRSSDGSGKCTVVTCAGGQVFGVVFDIASGEKHRLDRAEGLGHGYTEENLLVTHEDGPLKVFTYVAEPNYVDQALAPYSWYRDIVVAGAREHRLPEPYIQFLLDTDAMEDPDRERDLLNQRLLAPLVGSAQNAVAADSLRSPLSEKDLDLYRAYRARIEEFLHLFLLWIQLHEGSEIPENAMGHGAAEFKSTLFTATTGWLSSLVDRNRSALNVFDVWLLLFPDRRDEIEAGRAAFDPIRDVLRDFRDNVAFHANKSWKRQEGIRARARGPEVIRAVDQFLKLYASMLRAESSRPELAAAVLSSSD